MSQKQEPNVATLQQESNLTALQQEYARVKEEKTRLSRLQELSELEAKLKSQLDNYQLGEE
jgi:hypothetical protein